MRRRRGRGAAGPCRGGGPADASRASRPAPTGGRALVRLEVGGVRVPARLRVGGHRRTARPEHPAPGGAPQDPERLTRLLVDGARTVLPAPEQLMADLTLQA